MLIAKMKKIRLIAARADTEIILRELINLGCVQFSDPDELLENPELKELVTREELDITQYNANEDSIALLGTQYTLLLTGWMTASSEAGLTEQLSKYLCAWEIENPTIEESDNIPVKRRGPKFLNIFFKAANNPFKPLNNHT